jgi:hypothetical protein
MDERTFWKTVQRAHDQSAGDMDAKCMIIKTILSKLSKEDGAAFSHFFDAMMDRAYSWSLWGAAYVINGGCGDDAFSDFRASLISRGCEAFEAALANPESLAEMEFDEEAWYYEGYQYAISDGVEAAVGSVVKRAQPHPRDPSGHAWTEEEVYDLFPTLAEKFG